MSRHEDPGTSAHLGYLYVGEHRPTTRAGLDTLQRCVLSEDALLRGDALFVIDQLVNGDFVRAVYTIQENIVGEMLNDDLVAISAFADDIEATMDELRRVQ